MAKMAILPVAFFRPGAPVQPFSDALTTTTYDANAGVLTSVINGEATLVGVYRSSDDTLVSAEMTLTTLSPSTLTVARINRILSGLAAPNLESYHRLNGALVWRVPGTPALATVTPSIRGDLTGNGSWVWYVQTAPGMVASAYAAPVAPVHTPTPAPAAPRVAPVITAENLDEVFPPLPEAPVAPVAPTVAPIAPTSTVKVAPNKADADKRHLFTYPALSTTNEVIISDENRRKINAAWAKHTGGSRTTLAFVGPAGTGKTSVLDYLAAQKGVGIFTFDAMGASSFSDWAGRVDLAEGEHGQTITKFNYSSFIEAIRADGDYAGQIRFVRVDEVNRAESGSALNILMPILAQGSLYVPETGETIRVDPAVLFAFTMNRGSAYNAAVSLDEALEDRMQMWVRLDYLEIEDEVSLLINRVGLTDEQARPLVMAARTVRECAGRGEIRAGISHRRVLDAAEFVKVGLSAIDATMACWADKYPDEGDGESDRGQVIIAINSVLKPTTTTPGA